MLPPGNCLLCDNGGTAARWGFGHSQVSEGGCAKSGGRMRTKSTRHYSNSSPTARIHRQRQREGCPRFTVLAVGATPGSRSVTGLATFRGTRVNSSEARDRQPSPGPGGMCSRRSRSPLRTRRLQHGQACAARRRRLASRRPHCGRPHICYPCGRSATKHRQRQVLSSATPAGKPRYNASGSQQWIRGGLVRPRIPIVPTTCDDHR